MVRIAAALALVLVLTGCSAITAGTVTEKVVEPAYTYVTMMPCGKGCMMPITHHTPEAYRLDLEQGDESGYVYVTPSTFADVEVGEHYSKDKP